MGKGYIYHSRAIYVRTYEAVNSRLSAIFFRDKKGYERRLVIVGELDIYSEPEEAQAALDAFAERHGLSGDTK